MESFSQGMKRKPETFSSPGQTCLPAIRKMSLLQDIEITDMGFPKPEFIQLCARRVPVGHESAHNCMNECMGKPIFVILISCKSLSEF